MKTDSSLSAQLLEGETVCFEIPSATVLMYWILSGSLVWWKKITVTNKRIVIAYNWFGVESYRGAFSYFYNEYEYKLFKKPRSSLIGKYSIGKLKFFGDYIKITPGIGFIKPKVVIFTSYSQRIAEILSRAG